VFAWWVYADPGLVSSYFSFVFMYQIFKGTAEDAPITLTFAKSTADAPLSKAITIYSFDNALNIRLAYDGINYEGVIEVPANRHFHLSQRARSAQIYNKTVGVNARFQFIAWYVISDY